MLYKSCAFRQDHVPSQHSRRDQYELNFLKRIYEDNKKIQLDSIKFCLSTYRNALFTAAIPLSAFPVPNPAVPRRFPTATKARKD